MSPKPRSSRAVIRARIAIIVFAVGALATFLWWQRRPIIDDSHRSVRQLILHYTLVRVDDPIIVLGDSIVEASALPRSLCGHPIVNAGLSGASTASDLGRWLSGALAGKRAILIAVALGTNDALEQRSRQTFGTSYTTLLAELSKMTPHVVVLTIPPIEARGKVTVEARDEAMDTINDYNSMLPDLARESGAGFIALPAMPGPYTIDGVHLNAAGYLVWDKAVLQGVAPACNPG
jgi:lysophospholipase L1-like esterase